MFYDVTLQERVLLPLTNVPDQCSTAVFVKGSIQSLHKCDFCSLNYTSLIFGYWWSPLLFLCKNIIWNEEFIMNNRLWSRYFLIYFFIFIVISYYTCVYLQYYPSFCQIHNWQKYKKKKIIKGLGGSWGYWLLTTSLALVMWQ